MKESKVPDWIQSQSGVREANDSKSMALTTRPWTPPTSDQSNNIQKVIPKIKHIISLRSIMYVHTYMYTVKPVNKGHPIQNMVFIDKWSLFVDYFVSFYQ